MPAPDFPVLAIGQLPARDRKLADLPRKHLGAGIVLVVELGLEGRAAEAGLFPTLKRRHRIAVVGPTLRTGRETAAKWAEFAAAAGNLVHPLQPK